MTKLTDAIRALPHWDIAIRPEPFDKDRVDRTELVALAQQAAVRFRGWPVPYVGNQKLLRGPTWVGQDIEPTRVPQMEAWRMFTSGQFAQLRVISAAVERDTRDQHIIQVWEVLFYLTEVFEFASRLALTKAGAPSVSVDVFLRGAGGRTLVPGEAGRMLWGDYALDANEVHYTVTMHRDRLVASAREQAVIASVDFFWAFGWTADSRTLTEYQQQLFDRF